MLLQASTALLNALIAAPRERSGPVPLSIFTDMPRRPFLVEEIAERTELSKGEAQRYLEAFANSIAEVLKGGKEVQMYITHLPSPGRS